MIAVRGVQTPKSPAEGGPPGTEQLCVGLKTTAFFGAIFSQSMLRLAASISHKRGARLPGSRRKANRRKIETEGAFLDDALLDRIG